MPAWATVAGIGRLASVSEVALGARARERRIIIGPSARTTVHAGHALAWIPQLTADTRITADAVARVRETIGASRADTTVQAWVRSADTGHRRAVGQTEDTPPLGQVRERPIGQNDHMVGQVHALTRWEV